VVIGRFLSRFLEVLRQEFDIVVSLAVNHDEGLGFPCAGKDLKQLTVVQYHVVVGHEDLEGGVAVIHQGRQFLRQHGRARTVIMRWKP
jgi:hypothetical protein